MMTVGIYIAISNMIGLFGLKSPTKDVGVTGALALMSIILVEYAGIHQKGVKGFLKKLCRADNNNASYEHIGSVYQTTVVVYAFIW